MTRTWILVAHRSGATLFSHTGLGPLALVREIPHPEGHLKNGDIVTDKAGRSMQSGTANRSGVGTDYEPTRDLAEGFARSLASTLSHARMEHSFEALILMAEPRFLGSLRAALDAPTAAMVVGSVGKDLPLAHEPEVRAQVSSLLNV